LRPNGGGVSKPNKNQQRNTFSSFFCSTNLFFYYKIGKNALKKNNLIIAFVLLFLSHWAIACKCIPNYRWLTMREYNTHTIFVGKLLSAYTPPENLLTIELQYQVVTNYRNTPVGDTITVYCSALGMTAESYQQLIGYETLIYTTYNLGSYHVVGLGHCPTYPPPRVSVVTYKDRLKNSAPPPHIVVMYNNIIHTWQLIDDVKNRGNKMMKSYHANGVLEAKGKLKNSMPDGEWHYYDDKGRLIESIVYKEGIRWGESWQYIYENDTLYSSMTYYKDDIGINTTAWANGELVSKSWGTTMVNVGSYRKSLSQLAESVTIVSYTTGNKIASKREMNLVDKERRIYETTQFYYYPNGQIKEQWTEKYEPYAPQSKVGKWLRYAENGQLIQDVPYDENGYEINQQNR
jgi:antitoxin component YwqK of YwqJK toxin-antitoxin module